MELSLDEKRSETMFRLSLLYFLWVGRTASSVKDIYTAEGDGAQGFLVKVQSYYLRDRP